MNGVVMYEEECIRRQRGEPRQLSGSVAMEILDRVRVAKLMADDGRGRQQCEEMNVWGRGNEISFSSRTSDSASRYLVSHLRRDGL